jgi:transglutaminase-like putative cysteine protease
VIEIGVFAALAWFAAAHWAHGLVADAPAWRVFACVVIAVAVAAAVPLVDRVPAPWGTVMRLAAAVSGLGAGLVTIGLDRRLLAPAHWDELGDGLDRGFAGLASVEWPYDGTEPWTSLVLLLAIPLVLGVAAALAAWPIRALRPFALVLLVAMYGMAVTEHEFRGEPARGAALLLLVAAWLWLPRMPERGGRAAVAAAGAVLVACLAALPAAAGYDDGRRWVDYESWNPFEAQAASRFDWSHSYGPIDWPRDGTTLMNVRSDKRHYWKLETLDFFDGTRWRRSGVGRNVRPSIADPYREEWESEFDVTIRDLDTDLFAIAGTALSIDADPVAVYSDEGTVEAAGESLDEGESYSVRAYVPAPTPDAMRAAPEFVDPEIRFRYTEIVLPVRAELATAADLADSPYGRVQSLARRLATGQETTYDVVRAVQRHLRSEYIYSERPSVRDYPLAAFLLRDRVGYCQHFSGAMALMLRMLDIPARVAGGFTPGSYNADTKEYRVRDLDAHSWVEVWFSGIGWVPFDPTPSVAPADSQSSAEAASASGGDSAAGEVPDPPRVGAVAPEAAGGEKGADEEPGVTGWLVLAALVLAGGAGAGVMRARGARHGGDRRSQEEADIGALVRVLSAAGEHVPARATLRQLESRLERTAGAPAARYVRMVRERRFAPAGGERPDAAARRDLRRALARGRGLRARLAALIALPPAAFRRG